MLLPVKHHMEVWHLFDTHTLTQTHTHSLTHTLHDTRPVVYGKESRQKYTPMIHVEWYGKEPRHTHLLIACPLPVCPLTSHLLSPRPLLRLQVTCQVKQT